MSNAATKSSGCLGCLGTITVFAVIGSIIFGGGILFRIANFVFVLGKPVDNQRKDIIYLDNLENQKKSVDEAIKKFHVQLEQGKCQEIYQQANELLKKRISQADLLKMCEKTNRELGKFQSSQQLDWWWQLAEQHEDRYIYNRNYATFSNSSVQEHFIWIVKNNQPELIDYQIAPINLPQNQRKDGSL